MNDLTIIYLTANLIPDRLSDLCRRTLLEAVGGTPIISVSRKPMDFGLNIIDDGEKGVENIYRQMLRAAKVATTPFIAIAEDDTLYHESHFTIFRPPLDSFAYDLHRFCLFDWDIPNYNWRDRKSNCTLIAPRELMIEALEERFARWPEGLPKHHIGELGRPNIDAHLEVTIRKCVEYYAPIATIMIQHNFGSEAASRGGNIQHKRRGPIVAYDIPYWGHVTSIIKQYV